MHLGGSSWVITEQSSKFHSVRDYKLYSGNTVSLKSVTCWNFSGFPVSWGGTFSCSHTALIVCVFRHFFFNWDFFWPFPPAATFSPGHQLMLATAAWLLLSLSTLLIHGTLPVWQSCPVHLPAASTWQVSLSCSGSHPLLTWEVHVLLLKSTWRARTGEAQPLGCSGKKLCLFFQWSSVVTDSWRQPIFTAYCHPGLGTVTFCCQERILSPSCWIHLCFS